MTTITDCKRMPLMAIAIAALMCLAIESVSAEGPGSRKGHGHFSAYYQYIHVDGFEGGNGKVPIGTVDTQVLLFDVQYFLTDRLSIEAGLPFVWKRYDGPGPHDPLRLVPPRPEVPNIDDGRWNSDFQDFHLGVRYIAKEGTFQIEPYMFYGLPTQDYPHFGHAAVGQNLWKFEVGASFILTPMISDAWYRLDLGYVFAEETLDTNIDHWLIRAETGYFFKPNLSGRLFIIHKDGNGLTSGRADFPDRTNERWYNHDRMVMHNYTNAGLGLDWYVNQNYAFSGSLMTQIRSEWVHIMEYAITFQLSRSF